MANKGEILIDVNDVIGKRLGKLEVLEYHHCSYDDTSGGQRMRHYYVCRCECGTVKLIRRGPITSGIVHSCGCSRRRSHSGD